MVSTRGATDGAGCPLRSRPRVANELRQRWGVRPRARCAARQGVSQDDPPLDLSIDLISVNIEVCRTKRMNW